MVVLSTRVSYTTQLSGSIFHSGELYNTTEWWYFHARELYNTTELTRELSDVCKYCDERFSCFRREIWRIKILKSSSLKVHLSRGVLAADLEKTAIYLPPLLLHPYLVDGVI